MGKTYSHGVFESSQVVVNSFRRFFDNHEFLPLHVVRDGSSAFKKNFKLLEELTSKRGVEWIVTHNPQGKPHVESFFKTFAQSICSYHEFFIGMGITVSNIDSRITSKVKLKEKIGDRSNLGTYEELVLDIDHLIDQYNNTKVYFLESPNEKFERLFELNEVINLHSADKVAMACCFKQKRIKNCEFSITSKNERHYFQLPEEIGENIESINVAYDPSDLSVVHTYDKNLGFHKSIEVTELIPFVSSQRTSKQQAKYLKELAARRSRFKILKQNIEGKKERVKEATSNSVSFEVLKIHTNKEEEIESQNEFSRMLLTEEKDMPEKEKNIKNPPNSYMRLDESRDFKRLRRWK